MRRKKEKGQEAGETGRQSLRCNAVSPSVMCGEEEGSMCRSAVQRSEAQFGSVQIHFSFWPWLWLWLRLGSDHSRPSTTPAQRSPAPARRRRWETRDEGGVTVGGHQAHRDVKRWSAGCYLTQ